MKIAIDCRYLGMSGIGRVLEGILDNLDFSSASFTLIGKEEKLKKYRNCKIFIDETSPTSIKGMFPSWKEINQTCDALFIPNFIVPFSCHIKVYTIYHDLIFLDRRKVMTKNLLDFLLKRSLLKRGMKKSQHVFCISRFTLQRCQHYFPKQERKLSLCYDGISKKVIEYSSSMKKREKKNQILFVGNVKPHKGLPLLLSAFQKMDKKTRLLIVGDKDSFLTGLKIEEKEENVTFTGKITDEKLFELIAESKYLILPSEYEGFGMPPLEALCLNTQPILSSIPVFKEIYSGLNVKFFTSEEDLIAKMKEEPDDVSDQRESVLKKYPFDRQAKEIMDVILHG